MSAGLETRTTAALESGATACLQAMVRFCGRVEVRGSHPSLEKREGWATQLLWFGQGCATRQSLHFIDIRNASTLVCVEIWSAVTELDANEICPDLKCNNP
jgi:hypothetical protein